MSSAWYLADSSNSIPNSDHCTVRDQVRLKIELEEAQSRYMSLTVQKCNKEGRMQQWEDICYGTWTSEQVKYCGKLTGITSENITYSVF